MSLLTVIVVLVVGMLGRATPASAGQSGGTKLFLQSAINLDVAAETVTLPLFKGLAPNGGNTWYIITESSDQNDAEARGVNLSPKLANALGTAAVQKVKVVGGLIKFAGTVDFRPDTGSCSIWLTEGTAGGGLHFKLSGRGPVGLSF